MKVLLYYLFTPIRDPQGFVEKTREFCKLHNLKGRILISKEGINGTVGGEVADCDAYKQWMHKQAAFKDIWFKEQDLSHNPFPRLQVRHRKELVTLRIPAHPKDGCKHLEPAEVNKLVAEYGDDVIFFDARNDMEYRVGHFKDALNPKMKTFRDLPRVIKENKDKLSGKKVIMYCTGGIRCEVGSVIMKEAIPDAEVFQINGGIYNYCQSGNNNLWQGTCYVFDDRINVAWDENGNLVESQNLSDDKIISECEFCHKKCTRVINDERHLERVERVCCEDCDAKNDISRMRTKEERKLMIEAARNEK